MSDFDIIIFAITGVAIILVSLYVVISMTQDINISIHAPHAGSDSENYQQSMLLLIVFSKKQ